jgi:hypothetical protein
MPIRKFGPTLLPDLFDDFLQELKSSVRVTPPLVLSPVDAGVQELVDEIALGRRDLHAVGARVLDAPRGGRVFGDRSPDALVRHHPPGVVVPEGEIEPPGRADGVAFFRKQARVGRVPRIADLHDVLAVVLSALLDLRDVLPEVRHVLVVGDGGILQRRQAILVDVEGGRDDPADAAFGERALEVLPDVRDRAVIVAAAPAYRGTQDPVLEPDLVVDGQRREDHAVRHVRSPPR